MLNALHIEQFAIIDSAHIHFERGFNVLSGETGAGKSILIDALSLALGERAEAAMIRHGADKASIQAIFTPLAPSLQSQLQTDDLDDPDNPTQCLIRRQIRASGSKAYLNDQTITSRKLKTLSEQLISIHGQQANQSLLKSSAQRQRLDRFAQLQQHSKQLQHLYQQWQAAELAHQNWLEQQASHRERLSLLDYQLEELNDCAPQADEFEQLAQQQISLSAADDILHNGNALTQLLRDNDDLSANALLHQGQQLLEQLSRRDPRFNEAAELLEQSLIYLDEAYDTLNKQLFHTEHDPEKLAAVETRMSALHSLARKHHCPPEQLHDHWQQLRAEHEQLSTLSDSGTALATALTAAEKAYNDSAKQLSAQRAKAAKTLSKEVENWIRQLGMEQAVFSIALQTTTPSASGIDEITFLLCANPGQSAQALNKVASGGELSRISLAIEVACLDEAAVPSIIFDEIDAGIGGEVADTVGKLLHKLSANRQVLCITHLPQVAAYADHHFLIEKSSDKQQTQTRVTRLNDKQRIREIARMLGNADSTTSQEHAKTMLAQKDA